MRMKALEIDIEAFASIHEKRSRILYPLFFDVIELVSACKHIELSDCCP
jgi:hypothetical protein